MYQQADIEMTYEDIRLFTSGLELSEEEDDEIIDKLLETTCRVHMLRCEEEVKVGDKGYKTKAWRSFDYTWALDLPFHGFIIPKGN